MPSFYVSLNTIYQTLNTREFGGPPPLLSVLATALHLPLVGTWRARKALGVPYEIAYKRWKMNPSVSYADSSPSQGRLLMNDERPTMNDKSGLRLINML